MGIIGPIIIAGAGTAIGTYFQDRSNKIKLDDEIRQSAISTAVGILTQVSQAMDSFMYWVGEFYNGIILKVPKEEMVRRWEGFQGANREWVSTVNFNYSGVTAYFGKKIADCFLGETSQKSSPDDTSQRCLQGDIDKKFARLRKIMAEYFYSNEDPDKKLLADPEEKFILDSLHTLPEIIRKFNLVMLKMILAANVGPLRKSNT
jgi:hypothetical protein